MNLDRSSGCNGRQAFVSAAIWESVRASGIGARANAARMLVTFLYLLLLPRRGCRRTRRVFYTPDSRQAVAALMRKSRAAYSRA
jgi:hypothetical protein